MASNKKPRKKYREKAIHLPMMAESRDRMAMRLHLNVEAMIEKPDSNSFNELCKKVAAMSDSLSHLRGRAIVDDKDAAANAVRTMVMTLAQIQERSGRINVLSVSEAEAVSLRTAAGKMDEALAQIPKNVMDASIILVRQGVEKRLG